MWHLGWHNKIWLRKNLSFLYRNSCRVYVSILYLLILISEAETTATMWAPLWMERPCNGGPRLGCSVAQEVYLIGRWKRTICSIYIPPTDQVTEEDMRDFLKQLPAPMILLGDFNKHNTLWGSERTSTRGRMLEKNLRQIQPLVLQQKKKKLTTEHTMTTNQQQM